LQNLDPWAEQNDISDPGASPNGSYWAGLSTSGRLEASARGLGFSLKRSYAELFNEQLPPFSHSSAMSLSPAELTLVIDIGNNL